LRFARLLALVLFGSSLFHGSAALRAQAAAEPSPEERQAITAQQPPSADQAYHLPPDKLAKAKTLNKIRLTLEIVGTLWSLAVMALLLTTRTAAGLGSWAASLTRMRWLQGVWFFSAFFVITFLASLPLDMIGHTVSRHFGISVQGWAGWFGDQGKSLGLTIVFGCLGLLLFNWIVKVSPRHFWLWCWIVAVPLSVAGAVGEPLLEPIFDKFEPLSQHNAPLVADLEKVVARTGTQIPPDRMYLMKASVKTNGLNAYVTGLGATKRIVVWDTTAGRVPNDEVMFIFGHETGHYVLHHIVKGLIASAVGMFFLFWACAAFAQWLVGRYGESWDIHEEIGPRGAIAPLGTRAGFVVLLLAVSIAGFILTPASNTVSRYMEHQADVYGQEAMHGLVPDPQKTAVAAFNALGEAWLEDPEPSRLVEFWLYNHPSVKNRANFAAHYDPWANGGHGEFFKQ
jgi:Zn-dependent protease with chaperone function